MYLQDKITEERRQIAFFSNSEARKALANDYPFQKEQILEEWVKIIWYSDKSGGKLITFKAGNPHLPKVKQRKEAEAISEQQREERRLANSLSRTRKRIFEIAACNEWQWFFTGTLDGEKVDRNNLDETFKRLSQWIRDQRKKTGCEVRYLIVPEQHKDGAWHFHGLLSDVPENQIFKFCISDKIPLRIKRTIKNGTEVFTWKDYAEKFGYSTATAIRDEAAVSCYITKYITKEMITENKGIKSRKHLYYASQGLKKPCTLAESYCGAGYLPTYDFENEYVQIRKLTTKEEAKAIIERFRLVRE